MRTWNKYEIEINLIISLTHLPHFADKAKTKGVVKFSQRDPFECFCSTTAGEERVSSERAAEDWVLGQQGQRGGQGEHYVERCWFFQWMRHGCLRSADKWLILGYDWSVGLCQQSSTVEWHLKRRGNTKDKALPLETKVVGDEGLL